MAEDSIELDSVLVEAMRAAAEYARYLGSSAIDTEHLLLGFVRTAQPIFRGVSNAVIRGHILEKVERGTPIDPSSELPIAAGVVRALRLPSAHTAEAVTIRPATAGEVLLAIVEDMDSLAGQVVHSVGIKPRDQLNIS